jgi:hypothetical protein
MSLRITLAAAALGTLLVSPGHARDVSDAQARIRSPDQARSYTVSPYAREDLLRARSILPPMQRFTGPLLM